MDSLLVIASLEALLVGALAWRCIAARRRVAAEPVLVRLITRR